MATDDYLQDLQAFATSQGQAKLRTLALEFEGTLARLLAMRREVDAMLQHTSGVNFDELAGKIEPQLAQAADFLLELDLLPARERQEESIAEFIATATEAATLRTLPALARRFHGLREEVKGAKAQAVAEAKAAEEAKVRAEAKAKADKEAKTKAEAEAKADKSPILPQMLRLPQGQFWMGDGSDKHQVTIGYDLEVAKYPVTFAEFDRFVKATRYSHTPNDYGWGRDKRPVIDVNCQDAQNYINWLNEQTGCRYRLLSESEWEYAARAGTTTRYWWGDSDAHRDMDPNATYKGNSGGRTSPVDVRHPNPWGLHDMLGNVWEWCQDIWHDNYKGAPTDGRDWQSGGDSALRVLRGGSWYFDPVYLRAAYRFRSTPDIRIYLYGFRLARTL